MRLVKGFAAFRRPVDDGPTSDLGLEDAFFSINQFQATITGADTKASVLGAGATLVTTLVAPRWDALLTGADPGAMRTVASLLPAVLFAAGLGATLFCVLHLGLVLVPRVPNPGGPAAGPNRFAFPAVADLTPEVFVALDTAQVRVEAWEQAHTLAVISVRKHRHLRRALRAFGLGIFLIVAAEVVVALPRLLLT